MSIENSEKLFLRRSQAVSEQQEGGKSDESSDDYCRDYHPAGGWFCAGDDRSARSGELLRHSGPLSGSHDGGHSPGDRGPDWGDMASDATPTGGGRGELMRGEL